MDLFFLGFQFSPVFSDFYFFVVVEWPVREVLYDVLRILNSVDGSKKKEERRAWGEIIRALSRKIFVTDPRRIDRNNRSWTTWINSIDPRWSDNRHNSSRNSSSNSKRWCISSSSSKLLPNNSNNTNTCNRGPNDRSLGSRSPVSREVSSVMIYRSWLSRNLLHFRNLSKEFIP